jgi:hypothetical protein
LNFKNQSKLTTSISKEEPKEENFISMNNENNQFNQFDNSLSIDMNLMNIMNTNILDDKIKKELKKEKKNKLK